MKIQTKEFFTFYAPDCRKRHFHRRANNKVIEFVVQLEVCIKNKWYAIIRYDTSHKIAHCDVLHWKGKTEKFIMPTLNFREALTYADRDLSENWSIYYQYFLQEVAKNEK